MSKTAAKVVLAFALVVFSLAVTAGGVMSAGATESKPTYPESCLWQWFGPATRWQLIDDGCGGKCSPPTFNGTYLGQQEVTPCNGGGSGLSR